MSLFKDPISRRGALALGGTLAGTLASSAAAGKEATLPDAQLSASPDPTPASNGPSSPDTAGNGGELHRNAGGSFPSMTTDRGVMIADDENSLKVAQRGPVLLEISSYGKRSRILITSAFRSE